MLGQMYANTSFRGLGDASSTLDTVTTSTSLDSLTSIFGGFDIQTMLLLLGAGYFLYKVFLKPAPKKGIKAKVPRSRKVKAGKASDKELEEMFGISLLG